MSTSAAAPIAARKARNHAARMLHKGQVRPRCRDSRPCDIRRLRIAPDGSQLDLTFAGIAGSMDSHEPNEEEVFGL